MRGVLLLAVCLALALPATTAALPLERAAAKPDITGTTINGRKLSLKWYRGKWVFINAWASWCGPCNAEAAAYARFVRARPNLRFIGLNVADSTSAAKRFVKKYGWKWPSIKDPNRRLEAKLGGTYQPFIALVNPKGEVVGRHAGPGNATAWQRLLDRARR